MYMGFLGADYMDICIHEGNGKHTPVSGGGGGGGRRQLPPAGVKLHEPDVLLLQHLPTVDRVEVAPVETARGRWRSIRRITSISGSRV